MSPKIDIENNTTYKLNRKYFIIFYCYKYFNDNVITTNKIVNDKLLRDITCVIKIDNF